MTIYERTSERTVELEGLYNVRDLGGFRTEEGKRTRFGFFFRAGDLGTPTKADLRILAARGIESVVDFRSDRERALTPDVLPETVVRSFNVTIDTADVVNMTGDTGDERDAVKAMQGIYRAMVETARPQFRRFFEIVTDVVNVPLLFHCSAGKDRTGFTAAMLLWALGVSREDIYADYLMTNEGLGDKYAPFCARHPSLAPVMRVEKSYLDAAWAALDAFGGMETYLTRELNVDIDRLRHLFI
jgi:protein-tyrosine phosphatase